jgi:hypothetical protein
MWITLCIKGGDAQRATQIFTSRSASRVEAAGERFLLAVSPQPWVTAPMKVRALKGRYISLMQTRYAALTALDLLCH